MTELKQYEQFSTALRSATGKPVPILANITDLVRLPFTAVSNWRQ